MLYNVTCSNEINMQPRGAPEGGGVGGGGGDTGGAGCPFMVGRNNKQQTNSFNKQIPIGISHDAKGPQLECSQGPAVVHYT